jgi:hypothetical protein
MNETNEPSWLARLIISVGIIGLLAILVGCMIAPTFAPWIRRKLAIEYVMDRDWEEKVNADMKPITVFLWLVAIMAWAFVFWCNR